MIHKVHQGLIKMKLYAKRASGLLLFFSLFMSSSLYSIIDNRYLPLFNIELPRSKKPSYFGMNAFAMQAKQAFDDDGELVHLPEIFGKYDLYALNDSMNKVGLVNPLFLEPWYFQREIIWNMEGKLQVQGIDFYWEQDFCKYFSLGLKSGFLHCTSERRFSLSNEAIKSLGVLTNANINQGVGIALERARTNANILLDIEPAQWKKDSLADLEVYGRVSRSWEYALKCRSIEVALELGGIVPLAATADINNPASIPLGSDGFPGFYTKFETQIEAREDWFLGMWMQLEFSPSKVVKLRMPLNEEALEWGTIVGNAKVNPGLFFGISPFVAIEDFQDGWGGMIRFTYLYRDNDSFEDRRKDPKNIVNFEPLYNLSSWVSEYVSLAIIYDGARGFMGGKYAPKFYFNVDMPVHLFKSSTSAKTYKFTLGFEFNY